MVDEKEKDVATITDEPEDGSLGYDRDEGWYTVYHATGGFPVKVRGKDRRDQLIARGTHAAKKPKD